MHAGVVDQIQHTNNRKHQQPKLKNPPIKKRLFSTTAPITQVKLLKWITREYVHVDRTACPWLIRKFIDPKAEFIFAPTEKIEEIAKTKEAIPFDAPEVRLGHRNGKCSFETIIEEYNLKDPVLHELAKIVHSADTSDAALSPEGTGLNAIMTGARFDAKDDFEAVEKAEYVYEALYSYCKFKLLREKYKNELEKMDRKQQSEFLRRKMEEWKKVS